MSLNGAGAMKFPFCLQVGLVRFFWRIVGSEIQLLSINSHGRHPPVVVGGYTKKTASIIRLSVPHILDVFLNRRLTQVPDPVVRAIAIDVVNKRGPSSCVDKPNQMMGKNSIPKNIYLSVSLLGPSGQCSCFGPTANVYPPNKDAGIWVVVKKFAQTFCGKIGLSHAVVPYKQWFGQKPGSVSALVGFRHFNIGVA